MDLAKFCDSLSAMGPPCGPFHLEMQSLAVTRQFMAPHHPYINACGVDKKLSKMVGNSASYALYIG